MQLSDTKNKMNLENAIYRSCIVIWVFFIFIKGFNLFAFIQCDGKAMAAVHHGKAQLILVICVKLPGFTHIYMVMFLSAKC